MKKSNKAGRYNRFVQEPDESMFIIDGKKKVWNDQKNAFVDFIPMDKKREETSCLYKQDERSLGGSYVRLHLWQMQEMEPK